MIRYTDSLQRFSANQFNGFCVGWKKPLSPEKLYSVLKVAYRVVIAYDTETFLPVGFVYAISDGVLSAYIPLLEVLPSYQHQKTGSELMMLLLNQLEGFYMIDLCCDETLEKFYKPFGFSYVQGMVKRNTESL